MKLYPFFSLAIVTALAFSAAAAAPVKGWEAVKPVKASVRPVVKESDIEIMTAPSTIIVTASRNVQIKVFSILGRLISDETIPPGSSQLTVPTHGVYIVKVGDLTCKVAV